MRNGPSLTARAVALARSRLTRAQSGGGDPEAEQRLYAGLRTPILWPVAIALQGWVAARARFFDQVTLKAIEQGLTQVVVVGAGYDGRALRFRQAGIRFFEVDHPATQADKRRRLEQLGLGAEAITYVAHDLTEGKLSGALAAAGHAADQASLFICEGLLLYLTPEVAEELLLALCSRAAPGSLLALSADELPPRAGVVVGARTGLQRLMLAAIREPRRSFYRSGELGELLKRGGWRLRCRRAHPNAGAGRLGMLVLAEPSGPA